MKVKVKVPFYNDTGLHKRGEIVETAKFDSFLMEKVVVEKEKESEPVKVVREKKTKAKTK